MLKRINSRIGIKLGLVFLAVLCLAMGGIVVFNSLYYGDFGEQVVAENERQVQAQAFAFLHELTQQRAQKYQAVFDKLAASSRLIARQAELRFQLTSEPPHKLVEARSYLNVRPANGMFYTDLAKPVTVCYWGGPTIPEAVDKELNILLPALSVLAETRDANPEVVASHLIMTSGSGYYYPNTEIVYALPPVSELDLRDTNNYVLASPRNNPARKTVWVPVYFDDVGNGLITTVTTPFFGRNGEFLGVAGMDVPLERIHSRILHGESPSDGLRPDEIFSFLLDQRGKIISFPAERLGDFGIQVTPGAFRNSFDLLEKGLTDSSLEEVRSLGTTIAGTPGRTMEFTLGGKPYVVSWQQLPSTGWWLVSVVPQHVFLAPVREMQADLQVRLGRLQRDSYLLAILFFSGAMGITLILLNNFFIRPLRQITTAAERVRDGDLSPQLATDRNDEIGSLTASFAGMLVSLRQARELEQDYASRLEKQVAEQTRRLRAQKIALEQTLARLEKDILHRQQVEADLIVARDAADAANLAKAQFLANITHELRTPLIGVLGMNELLAETPLSTAQQSLLATAQRCGESLLEIINDVLDFSRIESGAFALEAREVEIGLLVEQTVALLAVRAERKGLLLACRVEPEALWTVRADAVRLRQILLNLIGNAIKFTSQGEVLVRLGMGGEEGGRGRFHLEVRDTGIGMSEEVQGRVLAPFVQGDATPTREFGGSGLGLAIVRQLVDLMGGELAMASEVGRGSVFRVIVPLPLVAECRPVLSPAVPGRRALLQAGHPFVRETLGQMLTALGFETVATVSGDEALRLLQESRRQARAFTAALISAAQRLADGTLLAERLCTGQAGTGLKLIGYGSQEYLLAGEGPATLPILAEPVGWHPLAEALGGRWPEAPLQVAAPAAAVPMVPAAESPQTAAAAPRRLLVADDYAVTRELVGHFLAGANVAIDEAASGVEALEALRNGDYDLILMDCSMPELDGLETTRRLRRQGCRTPIVALTAHIDSQVADACREAGMDDFLAKPFRRRQLEEVVARWLAPPAG